MPEKDCEITKQESAPVLRIYNYDIVFQEIPDEVTLALNITNCPCRCKGCHSKFLWEDQGEELGEESLATIINGYRKAVTCICFMGGDREPALVNGLAAFVKARYPGMKTGWYSGRQEISPMAELQNFDFIKVGPYSEEKGSLKERTTNQRLYKIGPGGKMEDLTPRFWRK